MTRRFQRRTRRKKQGKYKGVCLYYGKHFIQIWHLGSRIKKGPYMTEREAAKAYDLFMIEHNEEPVNVLKKL